MTSHSDVWNARDPLGYALVKRYRWFVHTTPITKIQPILDSAFLRPHPHPDPPPEVIQTLGQSGRNIICLHPLGSLIVPGGVVQTDTLQMEEEPPPLVTLALKNEDFRGPCGFDWSYEWPVIQAKLAASNLPPVEIALELINEYGSVATYATNISTQKLHVFVNGRPPADPAKWPLLVNTKLSDIHLHGS